MLQAGVPAILIEHEWVQACTQQMQAARRKLWRAVTHVSDVPIAKVWLAWRASVVRNGQLAHAEQRISHRRHLEHLALGLKVGVSARCMDEQDT